MSDLQVRCPGCHTALRIPANAAGSKVRCSNCQKVLAVPTRKPLTTPATAPAVSPVAQQSPVIPQFQSTFGQPAASAPEPEPSETPRWLLPAVFSAALVVLLMIGGTVFVYNAYSRSATAAVQADRAAASDAHAQAAAAQQQELLAIAMANPIPDSWTRQGARGVTVMMPAKAIIREVTSPIKGTLALRVDGTDPDSGSAVWLTVMPIESDTEIRRDQWLRNLYQYSGGEAKEILQVTRGDVVGTRVWLQRDGKLKDPLMEVFMLPDRLVITSVQPAGPELAEAFFASLAISSPTSRTPSGSAVATNDAASGRKKEVVEPAGDEARRKRIFLEYRKYAEANTSRTALPGIRARDAVDRLMGQVNESQVQAFLILHNLNEKELGELITEGNNKNWTAP